MVTTPTAPATRTAILEAAAGVFARRGYARTTIADLAQAAGVTRPTVYAYFPDKDAVFTALAHRVRDDILTLQQRADTSSVAATFASTLTAYLDVCVEHLPLLTVIAHQALEDDAMRALWDEIGARAARRHAQYLERLVAAGAADPAAPPAVIAEAVTGIVMRMAADVRARPRTRAARAQQLIALHARMAGLA